MCVTERRACCFSIIIPVNETSQTTSHANLTPIFFVHTKNKRPQKTTKCWCAHFSTFLLPRHFSHVDSVLLLCSLLLPFTHIAKFSYCYLKVQCARRPHSPNRTARIWIALSITATKQIHFFLGRSSGQNIRIVSSRTTFIFSETINLCLGILGVKLISCLYTLAYHQQSTMWLDCMFALFTIKFISFYFRV
jgi:hypothetical protein